jgi:hypothetical protein
MKKKFASALSFTLILIVGAVATITAIKIYQLGNRPTAPTAATLAPALEPSPSPTNKPSPTPSPKIIATPTEKKEVLGQNTTPSPTPSISQQLLTTNPPSKQVPLVTEPIIGGVSLFLLLGFLFLP